MAVVRVGMASLLKRAVAATVLACALWPSWTFAYNEAGHFYSVGFAVRNLKTPMPTNWAAIIAFCAQLPDESYELDAVELGRSLAPWHPVNIASWWHADMSSIDIQRMVAVQQLLHGLTGGEAQAVQSVAADIVSTLALHVTKPGPGEPTSDQLCALGFAYHLLGDSFAHQTIDKPTGDPWLMYQTGYGHLGDGHKPDYPLYDLTSGAVRWNRWSDYTSHGGTYAGSFDGNLVRTLAKAIADKATVLKCWFGLRSGPECDDTYGDDLIEREIREHLPALKCLAPAVEDHGYDPCDTYMKTSLVTETTCLPSCRGAWDAYKEVAVQKFESNAVARDRFYGKFTYADPDLSYPDPRPTAAFCRGETFEPKNDEYCPYPNRTPTP